MSIPWLIVAAMEGEIRGIRKGLRASPLGASMRGAGLWSGTWRGQPVLLVRTGAGPENVRRVLSPLLAGGRFRGILSSGSAGALREGYRPGDVLVPTEIRTIPPLDPYRVVPDPELRQRLLEAVRAGPWRVHTEPMLTSSRVILTSKEKRHLGETCGAGSVEMESAVVGELAARAGLPFAVARVVLDEVSFSFQEVSDALRWWYRKQYARMIVQGALQPSCVLWLGRLGWRSFQASKRLSTLYLGYLLDGLTGIGSGTGPAMGRVNQG